MSLTGTNSILPLTAGSAGSSNSVNMIYSTTGATALCATGAWIPSASTVDLKSITERLKMIEERLAILYPDNILHEQFPALQEAYNEYKLIERLVDGRPK